MTSGRPLKLRARDPQDMDVIAAVLQDALVPLVDVAFLRRDKRFVMVANRFVWSAEDRGDAPAAPLARTEGEDARFEDSEEEPRFRRVNCGVRFDRVRRVRARGFDLGARDQILNLLTIKTEPGRITLLFSDAAAIRLEVSDILCHLEDIGETWPTRWQPQHEAGLEEDQQEREGEAGAPAEGTAE